MADSIDGQQQPLVAVCDGLQQVAVELELRIVSQSRVSLRRHEFVVQLHPHAQQPFRFAAPHGQEAMRRDPFDGLLVVEIHLELLGFSFLPRLTCETTRP